ncbi:MAG: hypothetical protein IPH05_18010 [Flavobacteriales bacterium]|jgi:hypothetical protein|nr:hypothetical protein [Flavobacteriales bacterium]MBK6884790.1 hypothetical protein [Flavobacteriales bacterium]MBK7102111.1 hypothetical protein [Flavobacteriales bacterium]MBK7112582.1 hypothetical protein [Flavobacteriales bacterium]MBK7620420.1 hypothetical protein [Flavobacteriales bacterium]
MALARTLLTLISTATLLTVSAQTIGDTTIALVVVQANYAQQFPGGDLVDRFGTNSNIGLGAFRKFSNNYTLGGEGSFMFGNKVVEPGILRNVINSAGQIVDNTGEQADVFLYERGWSAFATVGRIFPLFGPNPNSGLHLKLGGGYLRHKVRVQTQKNVVPQLEDEYLEGYDRLSAGPAALAYLGYQHLSNKGRVNFHIGLEFMAGFTQALRAYNFDTEQYNTPNRLDLLSGVRAGWSLPIYKKLDTGFHYY